MDNSVFSYERCFNSVPVLFHDPDYYECSVDRFYATNDPRSDDQRPIFSGNS